MNIKTPPPGAATHPMSLSQDADQGHWKQDHPPELLVPYIMTWGQTSAAKSSK